MRPCCSWLFRNCASSTSVTGPRVHVSPPPVTKTKQSKNNKSFILFKVNPELLCWITVTMHAADVTLLFPYRANVWTKNLLTMCSKTSFNSQNTIMVRPPFCLLKLETRLNRERHFYHFTGCYLKKKKKSYRPVWGLKCKGSMQELDKRKTKKGRWLILWMTTNADNMHLWFCSNSLQFSFFSAICSK